MSDETPTTVFLFYGEDTYSSSQKLRLWQKEFTRKHGDTNIEVIEGTKINVAEFRTNIEAIPFLSEKRLIIIKNFLNKGKAEDQEKVAEAIEKTPDFCVMIFHEINEIDKRKKLYKKISKIGKVEEFRALSPDQIAQWALNRSKKQGISLSFTDANYFSQICGHDLWTVSNEFNKLELFADKKEITKEMIDNLVTPSISSSIFKLTDALAIKKPQVSLKTLKILKESGEELSKIFFMIVRHFRILIQIRDMLAKGESQTSIRNKMQLHPFVAQTVSNQAKNFNSEKLREIYEKLLQIDINFKTGKIKIIKSDDREFQLAIEKFIIECCN